MSNPELSKEDQMIQLLEELVRWTKVTSIPQVKRLLEEILQSPEEKTAFQASDGSRTQGEIAKIAGVSQVTVSNYGKKWVKNGIAKPVSAMGGQRAVRLFSLEDFGIEVPEVLSKTKEATIVEEQPKPEGKTEGQQ
jgi:DNA-binding Lrp family transcriptional regulator